MAIYIYNTNITQCIETFVVLETKHASTEPVQLGRYASISIRQPTAHMSPSLAATKIPQPQADRLSVR